MIKIEKQLKDLLPVNTERQRWSCMISDYGQSYGFCVEAKRKYKRKFASLQVWVRKWDGNIIEEIDVGAAKRALKHLQEWANQ